VASRLYHDVYWYPTIGKKRVEQILATEWGELFRSYDLETYKQRNRADHQLVGSAL